jgi:hypothetical protein
MHRRPPANQTLFSINPFLSNTTHDAWFGTVTTGLSVFISATMLSKVNQNPSKNSADG